MLGELGGSASPDRITDAGFHALNVFGEVECRGEQVGRRCSSFTAPPRLRASALHSSLRVIRCPLSSPISRSVRATSMLVAIRMLLTNLCNIKPCTGCEPVHGFELGEKVSWSVGLNRGYVCQRVAARRSRRELETTLTELIAIAAAAYMGFSKPSAAMGIPITL